MTQYDSQLEKSKKDRDNAMNGNDGVPGAKTFLITTDFCKLSLVFLQYFIKISTAQFFNPIDYLWPRNRSLI